MQEEHSGDIFLVLGSLATEGNVISTGTLLKDFSRMIFPTGKESILGKMEEPLREILSTV